MTRSYTFAPGEYYHIYVRGFEKLPVFREKSDYQRFLEAMYLCNSEKSVDIRDIKNSKSLSGGQTFGYFEKIFELDRGNTLVDIGAYCLMSNHPHILIREKKDRGISRFMQKLMTSYTMYFNKKNNRTGRIFGSSFKAKHVTDDNHLKYLFAYIHLNPVNIVGKQDLKKYEYSSYADYLSIDRPLKNILNKSAFPDYFEGAMEKEIDEWTTYKDGSLPEV